MHAGPVGDMMEYDQIFNEDCLKGLASIPDKTIDLAILDPPYYFGSTCKGAIN